MISFDLAATLGGRRFHYRADVIAPITAVLGRSGSGKTTLARLLCGLLPADEGKLSCGDRVFFDSSRGINVPCGKRGIGLVFQEHRLFPHLSVRSNILYARRFCGRETRASFDDIVSLLGLKALLDRRPDSLSGGEAQRTALGRALIAASSFLVMDEPLASLDPALREDTLAYIHRVPQKFDIPIIYITHSPREAGQLAEDGILVDSAGIAARGPVNSLISNSLYTGGASYEETY